MLPKVVHCREHRRRQVLASATTGFKEFLSHNGGRADRIFASVGLAEDELADANRPVDLAAYVQMMELAAVSTGNDNFGLWYGQQFKPEMLGLIGGIALASPTLGAALANVAKLFPYHQQATHTAFKRQGEWMRLEYRIIDGGIAERRQDAELTLGMLVNVLRHCLGIRWAPQAVHFEHPKPVGWRQHSDAFLAPVHFGQVTNALIFRDDSLNCRMPHGDLRQADRLADRLIHIGGGITVCSLLDHVKGEIRARLPDGVPDVESIAAAVGLQRWTLQRRLMDYGLCFSDAIDLVRRELAERHLRLPHVTILEVSDLLGYSEPSAFSRACRRWFGISPQKFRAQRLPQAC
jgi:AraC-like DNA-binding protein